MRFNFTDTNPTIFNLEGKPFYGKLVFVAPGTTRTYMNVYDVEDNILGHVVTTNQYGRLEEQVILEGTYDVQYWEFSGTVYDLDDDTQWTLIRTDRVIDPEDNITFDVSGAMSFGTVEEMRGCDTEGLSDYTTCIRMGYYRGGDHEPLAYYWDSSASGFDDGGAVIQPTGVTGNGRWIAMFPEHINVKWFGVKSSALHSTVTNQSSAMIAAKNRSRILGKELYFPAEGAGTYYGVDSVSLDVGTADIRLDAGVRLVAKEGTTNSIECYNLYCDRGYQVFLQSGQDRFSVKAHEVWTASLSNYGDITADIVHWNKNIRKTTWAGCSVIFSIKPSDGMSFERCALTFLNDSYKFDNSGVILRFKDMEFTDRYFVHGNVPGWLDYSYLTVTNCTYDIDSFDSSVNWFNLQQEHGEADIDCMGRYMSSIVVKNSVTLHNLYAQTVRVNEGLDLAINHGIVEQLVYSNAEGTLTLVDVKETGGDSTVVADICAMNGCHISSEFVVNTLAVEGTDFDRRFACVTLDASRCTFLGDVEVYFKNVLHVAFNDNIVGSGAKLKISKSSGDTTVNVKATSCSITGNTILDDSVWIELDRTYLEPDDSKHDYVYARNSGGGLDVVEKYVQMPFGTSSSTMAKPCLMVSASTGGYSAINWMGSPFTGLTMFTIGTTNVKARITASIIGVEVTSTLTTEAFQYTMENAPLLRLPDYVIVVGTSDRITLSTSGESGAELVQALVLESGFSWKVNMGDSTKSIYGPSLVNMWAYIPGQMINGMASARIDGRKWTFSIKMERV